jgi:hypothetical protein
LRFVAATNARSGLDPGIVTGIQAFLAELQQASREWPGHAWSLSAEMVQKRPESAPSVDLARGITLGILKLGFLFDALARRSPKAMLLRTTAIHS